MKEQVLKQCQNVFPEWRNLSPADFDVEQPKGFSSFTLSIRAKKEVDPPAIFYRRLEGKDNAILDFETEKEVFLNLGKEGIAAHCHYYDQSCRLEAFYEGHTLSPDELFDPENLRKIAGELYRFHQIRPEYLPEKTLFESLFEKWGEKARVILEEKKDIFPQNERNLCEQLEEIYSRNTFEKVKRCLPDEPPVFCHNDTYHGNIMKLSNGDIKLLDFEFSCLNHKAYDFSNLFAETVMKHKQSEYPYFHIAEPEYSETEIAILINFYLDNYGYRKREEREKEFRKLMRNTRNMLMMSDFKYAMAALPLAVEPIQRIRFIPYAHARFTRFLRAYEQRFQNDATRFDRA